MNPKPISSARDPDLRLSLVALERAARRALELAARTGTAIVVSRNGVLERIEPKLTTEMDAAREPSAPYEDKA